MIINYCIKNHIKYLVLILLFIFIIISEGYEIDVEHNLIRFIKHKKKSKKIKENENYLNSIKEYINLIQKKKLDKVHYNNSINNPKISLISPVFNKEKYLKSLILSIQYQYIKEFEAIFVDDCSTDNSVNIINEFSKNDKRIKIIKNKINKGTLYSRSYGVLQSKGEYIIFIDSDDLLLQEGLYKSYNYIKRNDLSIVQFNSIFKINDTLNFIDRYYKYENIIRQPILSYIFYYNEKTKKAKELNTALWDKLMKKDISIKAVNFIGEEYYNEKIKIENDIILLFSIFKIGESYQYINETGYFYIRNNDDSITNSWEKPEFGRSIIHGVFINIKFFYEKSDNSYLGKLLCVFKLQQAFERYITCFAYAEKEFALIKSVLKLLMSSHYISSNDKIIISIINSSISLIYLALKSKNKIIKF